MPKLIVFTKAALVYATQDKRSPFNIYPGVARKLASLRIDGWRTAIASNEAIGAWEKVTAKDLVLSAQFRVKAACWFCDDFHTAKKIAIGRSGVLRVQTQAQDWLFGPEEPILIRYKTIASTAAELQFIASLCGIADAVFCPVLDGEMLYALSYDSVWGWRSKMIMQKDSWKPGTGMLDHLRHLKQFRPIQCVMIGEDASDYAAAGNKFKFIYSEDWRSGRVTV